MAVASHATAVMKGSAMRKPPRRAQARREPELVTTNQIMAWLDARLAADPKLRRSIARVLAALRKAEPASLRKKRRAG